MGGTFDPVHYGHLVTAEAARVEFGLEKVVFVPSGNPPHKKTYEVSPPKDRYLMTVLATATNPNFEVSRLELDRGGYSYAIDTVREFKAIYGADTPLFFITGADASLEILTWKDAGELLGMCTFIAATRPGYDQVKLQCEVNRILGVQPGSIRVMEVPALAISSTDIRQRVRDGKPIRYLLPEAVANYIQKAGLYR